MSALVQISPMTSPTTVNGNFNKYNAMPLTVSRQNKIGRELTLLALIQPTKDKYNN